MPRTWPVLRAQISAAVSGGPWLRLCRRSRMQHPDARRDAGGGQGEPDQDERRPDVPAQERPADARHRVVEDPPVGGRIEGGRGGRVALHRPERQAWPQRAEDPQRRDVELRVADLHQLGRAGDRQARCPGPDRQVLADDGHLLVGGEQDRDRHADQHTEHDQDHGRDGDLFAQDAADPPAGRPERTRQSPGRSVGTGGHRMEVTSRLRQLRLLRHRVGSGQVMAGWVHGTPVSPPQRHRRADRRRRA